MNYTQKFYNTYIAKYKKGGRISKADEGEKLDEQTQGNQSMLADTTTILPAKINLAAVDTLSTNIIDLLHDWDYIDADSAERSEIFNEVISESSIGGLLDESQKQSIISMLNKMVDKNATESQKAEEEIIDIITDSKKPQEPVKPKWQARTSSQIKKDMKKEGIQFKEGVYTVKSHDTPWSIAKAAGISLKKLAEYNPDKVDDKGKWRTIYVGDKINTANPEYFHTVTIPINMTKIQEEGDQGPTYEGVVEPVEFNLDIDTEYPYYKTGYPTESKTKRKKKKNEYSWTRQPNGKGFRKVKKIK